MPLSDFSIGKELGKGAFGSVCIVKRKLDNQVYAMKRVRIVQLNEKEKENALNEVRILASLSHKNIIAYKEAFFDEPSKTLNIVMEYADDGDISTKIKYNLKNGLVFRENIIWDYIIQILEGLKYLHEKKIIHRDLKSANLFVMKDGTIKIGDLNVSKINKFGMASTQIGTPFYASPEIWKDQPYDYKSDIWSIGCIIYELCQLKPPFRGTSIKNLAKCIIKGNYDDISDCYSNDLRKIIKMCLVLNPNNRPTSQQLLNCDFVQDKIKKFYNKRENGKSFLDEKADLIKTIKMPKNFKEINRALPMKRYNNIQREEMLMNDEYETKKRFFQNKNDLDEVKEFFDVENNNNVNNIENNYNNSNKKEEHNYKYNYNNIMNNQNNYQNNYNYNNINNNENINRQL
jgi:NIMA (never in mitosis gene a)-related kinase